MRSEDQKKRLLEVAGQIFVEKGFQRATVREICTRASANVAAVSYYFGSKEELYNEVILYAFALAEEKHPEVALDYSVPAEERLRAYVRSFLFRLLDEGRPAWHSRLMAREMSEPTAAIARLVEQQILPNARRLRLIVHELLDPTATEQQVNLCAQSVDGQCLLHYYAREVIARLNGPKNYTADMIEGLVEHITAFSLAAMRNMKS